jgi:hypothetical protein
VVHLKLEEPFLTSAATHETSELRAGVARLVPSVLEEFSIPHGSFNAADPGALTEVLENIRTSSRG